MEISLIPDNLSKISNTACFCLCEYVAVRISRLFDAITTYCSYRVSFRSRVAAHKSKKQPHLNADRVETAAFEASQPASAPDASTAGPSSRADPPLVDNSAAATSEPAPHTLARGELENPPLKKQRPSPIHLVSVKAQVPSSTALTKSPAKKKAKRASSADNARSSKLVAPESASNLLAGDTLRNNSTAACANRTETVLHSELETRAAVRDSATAGAENLVDNGTHQASVARDPRVRSNKTRSNKADGLAAAGKQSSTQTAPDAVEQAPVDVANEAAAASTAATRRCALSLVLPSLLLLKVFVDAFKLDLFDLGLKGEMSCAIITVPIPLISMNLHY